MSGAKVFQSQDDNAVVAEEGGVVKPNAFVERRWTFAEFLKPLKSLRYLIVRTVSVPVPFWSHHIPLIGGKTLVELGIMAFAAALAIGKAGSGKYSDIMSAMLVLLSMRFNVLTAIFGISFERALFWHKFIALVAIGCIGVHMKDKGNNNTGIAIIVLMAIACGSYLVKPYLFELFHVSHIVCYVMTIPYALKHGAKYFPYAIIFWGADLLLRYIVSQRIIKMEAEVMAGDVVRLTFPRRFEYEPGQYCFLLIPTINYFEFHPFSLASCPNEATTTLYVRALGDWSRRLYNKTKRLQEENNGLPVPMHVCCEGPFGTPAVDQESHNYKVWLLISGGIGITPLQSVYNHFIYQEESGKRQFRKVIFVWSVKDKATAEMMEAGRAKAGYLPLSFQPTMKRPPGLISQMQAVVGTAKTVEKAEEEKPQPEVEMQQLASADVEEQRARDSANQDGFKLQTPLVFHAEYYLTQIRSEEEFATANIDPIEQKHVHFGRPSIEKLFERTRQLCEAEGIRRVGVMVCGPASMQNDVMDLCQRSQLDPKCGAVRFDGHAETFNF